MVRFSALVIAVLCLSSVPLRAQDNAITITTASASVHKSPSTASPVIGRAARGETLEITRDVGDWVKVAWPSDPTGAGYVRLNAGSRGRPATASTARPAASRTSDVTRRPVAVAADTTPRGASAEVEPAPNASRQRQPATPPTRYVNRPRHVLGVGGRMNTPTFGVGGSLRGWSPGWLGLQLEVSRYAISTPFDPSQMTTTQFAPSVLIRPTDVLSDSYWLRPYVGAGIGFYRSTLNSPTVGSSTSDSQMGFQAFGGAEVTLPSMPSLGISLDFGVRTFETPFVGYDLGAASFAVSGHWYLK